MKVAVVGTGRWGVNLVNTFSQLDALAAIVEVDESRGRELAQKFAVTHYSSLDDLLATDVPAVAIATPVFSHYELAKKALLAKKDVFVEKPLATTPEEAEELMQLAKQNNCILMVGYLLLYQPAITFIKAFLEDGKLGKIFSMRQIRRSLGTVRTEENVLYSLGVHDLAVLNYLIDSPITKITATAQEIITAGIADDMSIHLQYATDIHAHVHLNWLWPIKERRLMILGEKGALQFDELRQEVVFYRHYGNKDATVTQEGSEIIFSDNRQALKIELAHFLECIMTRQTPRSSGIEGKKIVELMSQIMQLKEKSDGNTLLCS